MSLTVPVSLTPKYVKHCTDKTGLIGIIKTGEVTPRDEAEYVFGQIVYDGTSSFSYGSICLKFNKDILVRRKDYVINNGYVGKVTTKSMKPGKNIRVDPFKNEVLFTNSLYLKDLVGAKITVFFDDPEDLRLDLILGRSKEQYWADLSDKLDKKTLGNRYLRGKRILNGLLKYIGAENIKFTYQSLVALHLSEDDDLIFSE